MEGIAPLLNALDRSKTGSFGVVFLFVLLSYFNGFSQIAGESSQTATITIPVEEGKKSGLLPTNTPPTVILNNPFTASPKTSNKPEPLPMPSKNKREREEFLNPGDYYLSKLNRKEEKPENKRYGSRVNQYLGDVRNNGEFVEIIMRDHESPDGDRIKIMINDVVVVPDIMLFENFRAVNIDLQPGFNKIDFIALNQGSSGPNTAEVRIYDETGSLLAGNRWNLATGVKATYIVVKE